MAEDDLPEAPQLSEVDQTEYVRAASRVLGHLEQAQGHLAVMVAQLRHGVGTAEAKRYAREMFRRHAHAALVEIDTFGRDVREGALASTPVQGSA